MLDAQILFSKYMIPHWAQALHTGMLRCNLCAVVLEEFVIFVGGCHGTSMPDAQILFSTGMTPPWAHAPNMQKRRCNLGAVVVKGRVYVVGGYNGTHDLPNTEYLGVGEHGEWEGSWEWGPTMHSRRSGPGVAVLRDKIYACGGFNGWQLLDSVEEMDVRSSRYRVCVVDLTDSVFSRTRFMRVECELVRTTEYETHVL